MTQLDHSSSPLGDPLASGHDGVQRRTIVAGAAWTIPVVATAIATPASAASQPPATLSLAFSATRYGISSCGVLQRTAVTASTSSGGPTPDGTLVTVTLPQGLSFAAGGQVATVPTVGGVANAPDIVLTDPSTTTFSITASTGSPSDSPAMASVGVFRASAHDWNNVGRTGTEYGGVPEGSTAVGGGYYLDGTDLYFAYGQLVAQNVTSAAGFTQGPNNWVDYVSNGTAYDWSRDRPTPQPYPAVPAGSTAIGNGFFLSGSTLYYADGRLLATGVTSAIGFGTDTHNWVNYVSGGIAHDWTNVGGAGTVYGAVPPGSVAVGGGYYLDGTDLYFAYGQVIARNVTSAAGFTQGTDNWVNFVSNGTAYDWSRDRPTPVPYPGVPAASTAVGNGYFVSGTGLYYADGTLVATDVGSAVGFGAGTYNWVNYVARC